MESKESEEKAGGSRREEVGPGGAAGLQSTDNCQPSTVGVNLIYLPSGKRKKKVGCNLKILRLTREGGVLAWRWEEGVLSLGGDSGGCKEVS